MINLDWEKEHQKDSVFLQADMEEQYQRLKQEINEEESRLPARITVIDLKEETHELESNTLAF